MLIDRCLFNLHRAGGTPLDLMLVSEQFSRSLPCRANLYFLLVVGLLASSRTTKYRAQSEPARTTITRQLYSRHDHNSSPNNIHFSSTFPHKLAFTTTFVAFNSLAFICALQVCIYDRNDCVHLRVGAVCGAELLVLRFNLETFVNESRNDLSPLFYHTTTLLSFDITLYCNSALHRSSSRAVGFLMRVRKAVRFQNIVVVGVPVRPPSLR